MVHAIHAIILPLQSEWFVIFMTLFWCNYNNIYGNSWAEQFWSKNGRSFRYSCRTWLLNCMRMEFSSDHSFVPTVEWTILLIETRYEWVNWNLRISRNNALIILQINVILFRTAGRTNRIKFLSVTLRVYHKSRQGCQERFVIIQGV